LTYTNTFIYEHFFIHLYVLVYPATGAALAFFKVYTLQAMEAFVDAHLKSFDISEDLSLRVEPRFELHGLAGPTFGIGVSIPIGQRTSPTLPSVPTP